MFKLITTTAWSFAAIALGATLAMAQPAAPAPAAPAPPVDPAAQAATQNANQELQTFRAKQILGSKVSLSGDVSGGVVDDIVIDENGYVEYLIVMYNNKLVTIPWDAAAFNFEKRVAVVKIAPEQYEKVPTYTADKYPVFSTSQYRTNIYRSYGITPRERRIERRLSRP